MGYFRKRVFSRRKYLCGKPLKSAQHIQCDVAKQCPSPRRCCLSGSRQAPARPTLPPARCPAPAGRNKASTARRLSRPHAESAGICRHNACESGVPGAAAYPRCPTRTFSTQGIKSFWKVARVKKTTNNRGFGPTDPQKHKRGVGLTDVWRGAPPWGLPAATGAGDSLAKPQ